MSNSPPLADVFGGYVREQREERHWTRVQLGAKAGLTGQYISFLERGRHAPSFDTVLRIAYALGKSGADVVKAIEDRIAAARRN
jgi:transcriptional regulator with XRE-family HTH domain